MEKKKRKPRTPVVAAIPSEQKQFVNAHDISVLWPGISQTAAYDVIRKANEELEKQGKFTFRSIVSRKFVEKFLNA